MRSDNLSPEACFIRYMQEQYSATNYTIMFCKVSHTVVSNDGYRIGCNGPNTVISKSNHNCT